VELGGKSGTGGDWRWGAMECGLLGNEELLQALEKQKWGY